MDGATILFLSPDNQICPHGSCDQLHTWVKGRISQSRIYQKTFMELGELKSLRPHLIFIKSKDLFSVVPVLKTVTKRWPKAPVVGIECQEPGESHQINKIPNEGFYQLYSCPFKEEEMGAWLPNFLQNYKNSEEVKQDGISIQTQPIKGLIGRSQKFRFAVEKIFLLAKSDAPVLISGETGTGKELFARAIHYQSSRKGKPFVPVNCGALPELIVENELFGHVKGAFTDASAEKTGLWAESEGGTIFLDEVDTLSLRAQIKLLRVLQEHEYRPLGSTKRVRANVRVLAATNTNLWERLQTGKFREDLYFRLNILPLPIPPLRERPADILLLAEYLADFYAKKAGKKSGYWSAEARDTLLNYHWPGNVRELEALVQRTATFFPGQEWHPHHLDLPGAQASLEDKNTCLRRVKAKAIEQVERNYLTQVMTITKGNITKAAKAAGKERRAFQRLLHKYCIDRKAFLTAG